MTFTNRGDRDTEREREAHTKLDQGKAKMMDTMGKPMTTCPPAAALSHASIGLLAGEVHLP